MLKNLIEHDLPPKFVAILEDRSGAEIFYKQGNQYKDINSNLIVDGDALTNMGFLWFFELPDDFEVMV